MSSRYARIPRLLPMRRDRVGRDEFDPFMYSGLEFYFNNLSIDPRARRMMDSRLQDGFGFNPRSFDRRPVSEGRLMPDERFPLRAEIIHDDHGLECGLAITRSGSTLPFGHAMKDLHKQLVKAEELYRRFQLEYDNDTAAVKKYASAKTLRGIWASKVKGIRDPQTFAEGEDRIADEGLEKFDEKFAEMEKKLASALQVAASSTLYTGQSSERRKTSEKHQARLEASDRSRQRAHLALQHFMNLMEKAKESREDCRHLVNELQQYRGQVNPEAEINRELFKSSDEDEDVDGGGQCMRIADWDD